VKGKGKARKLIADGDKDEGFKEPRIQGAK